MTIPRSNVRVSTNVNVRMPGVEASADAGFKAAVRTREAILALNPWIKTAYGIDPQLAKQALTPAQLEVVANHFACPACKRWDRWPVFVDGKWELSYTPFGCLCAPARASELLKA